MSAEDILPLQSPPRSPAPSLFVTNAPAEAKTLLDLMYDGFYLIFLLRSGQAPESGELLRERIKAFMLDVERGANKLNSRTIDVRQVKYAFCAAVDETILRSNLQIRTEWQRQPLQLQYFGDQLGGERFFTTLENTRREGVARLQVLEVFHMCLLMGFQGKYVIEGLDQLNFLTARLGDEIAHHKGKRAGFAPHWAAPDQVIHRLRNEVPLWVIASVFLLFFVLAYTGFRLDLGRLATNQLASYHQLIKVAPEPAHVTITLP